MSNEKNSFFYIGKPIPEYNPLRLKLGYSSNLQRREKDHRCSSPGFSICKFYNCRKSWEKPLLAKLKREMGRHFISEEVVEFENENQMDQLFRFCEDFLQTAETVEELRVQNSPFATIMGL